MNKKRPKTRVTYFDTERAPLLGWFWELGEQRIHYGQIVQHDFFTSCQWQYDDGKVQEYSLLDNPNFDKDPMNDLVVVKKMREIMENTDVLVAHNGRRFDWPKFKAKMIYHRLKPVRKPHIFDTLTEARTSSFVSNKLGNLAKLLKTIEKLDNPTDFGKLVFGSIKERRAEIKKSVKYGLGDIPALKEIFYVLHPYSENRINIKTLSEPCSCPRCKSDNIGTRGESKLLSGMVRTQYICLSCKHRFKGLIRVGS